MRAGPVLAACSLLLAASCGGSGQTASSDPGDGSAGRGPLACGPTTCPAGEVCCNASCGICTPPDGLCTQQVCAPPPSSPSPCRADADCRTFSDYCHLGCNCQALSVCVKDPQCTRTETYCVADPCMRQQAYCREGSCSLRTIVTCPAERCGPQPAMPSQVCADGTSTSGPTGRCLQRSDGSCSWEIASCPDPKVCPVTAG